MVATLQGSLFARPAPLVAVWPPSRSATLPHRSRKAPESLLKSPVQRGLCLRIFMFEMCPNRRALVRTHRTERTRGGLPRRDAYGKATRNLIYDQIGHPIPLPSSLGTRSEPHPSTDFRQRDASGKVQLNACFVLVIFVRLPYIPLNIRA